MGQKFLSISINFNFDFLVLYIRCIFKITSPILYIYKIGVFHKPYTLYIFFDVLTLSLNLRRCDSTTDLVLTTQSQKLHAN